MSNLPPPDPHTRIKWEYAGFWPRFFARLGDSIVAMIYGLPAIVGGVFLIVLGVRNCDATDNGISCTGDQVRWTPIGIGLLAIFVGFAMFVVLPIRWIARTGAGPASRRLKVRIVCARTGLSIGTARSIGRWLGSMISGWIFYLGYLWMLWDSEKQTWHDKMVSSVVIRA